MIPPRHILFDLSEVLIPGIVGCETKLAAELGITPAQVLEASNEDLFRALLRGQITEEAYLNDLIERSAWPISVFRLREIIRLNFHPPFAETIAIAEELAARRWRLTLVSDHVREWVPYILAVHPFITGLFRLRFFSCEVGALKREEPFFDQVLRVLEAAPEECFFIDDLEVNIAAAARRGIAGVLYRSAPRLRADLQAGGML